MQIPKVIPKAETNPMSDQNNTSFAHAFLPGLILGLIIGAVAGAFVPDLMSGTKIKVDPAHAGNAVHERDEHNMGEDLIDDAQAGLEELETQAEDLVDDAEETTEDLIDDATNTLPDSP